MILCSTGLLEEPSKLVVLESGASASAMMQEHFSAKTLQMSKQEASSSSMSEVKFASMSSSSMSSFKESMISSSSSSFMEHSSMSQLEASTGRMISGSIKGDVVTKAP